MELDHLIDILDQVHQRTQRLAEQKVNQSLTFRNWLYGYYLREHEYAGEHRSAYGDEQLDVIAKNLSTKGVKGMSRSALYRFMQFYDYYPHLFEALAQRLQWNPEDQKEIVATLSRQLKSAENQGGEKVAILSRLSHQEDLPQVKPDLLISRLNFSHFLELIKVEEPLKRHYYEVSAIKENWSVRELRRAINTMMYERSGLSSAPKLPETKGNQDLPEPPAKILRSPLILEFLDIPEKAEYSESDLEQAIINDLQSFLMELGRGFCFEARQKRITFDNKHYYIDLVFYHRILKCHVLIDLKLGEFSHADAGQMNLYLNYYKENEKEEDDNPPIGIVLCAQKNDALVHYATGGMSKELFVGKYMLALPSEKELRELIRQETEKLNLQ